MELGNGVRVGRRDTCDKCGADLHACVNCRFHDSSAYNECREPQAERVLDKHVANFCDYFVFAETSGKANQDQNVHLDALENLFKK